MKKLPTKIPKITSGTRVIVKNKAINFKELLQIVDNFWALIVFEQFLSCSSYSVL